MAKINPLQTDHADEKQQELLQTVQKKMGGVPNILGTMAKAPAVLQAYLGFSEAMAESSLPPALRERLSLYISELNGCDYCLAAHTAIGKMSGLSEQETVEARQGKAPDPRDQAALDFARRVVESKGFVSDEDREAARQNDLGEQQMIEITGMVALNVLTNYFNHVVETDLDFPQPPKSGA